MTIDSYFTKECIEILPVMKDQKEYFFHISNKLNSDGYVNDKFFDALLDREKEYSTGLTTRIINVAIPHTDPDFVIKPFIYIGKLEEKTKFGLMGSFDDFIEVEYLFVLGVKHVEDQLIVLPNLMKLFSDEQAMLSLKNATTTDEIFDIIMDFYMFVKS